ncbi:sensor histidine kinase [Parasphingopyxis lamellibrachiae]|uniref:histidine kinase n=1 Tax=Parasphingopyxis lamellibrachiae TaxID=680125 RepID=A0A3D9FBA2_9SPHN|nr:ATP-binding protein [Parasphingopyxis lamellibrachiae]RED15124.1 two-component system phosphate regulon sensor histidine kinase PhoR [Parasphingopyxis lamellibrachiae]
MPQITPLRAIVALLTTFAIGYAAYALGAGPLPVILACIGGLIGGAILGSSTIEDQSDPPPPGPAPKPISDESLFPTLEELMNAIDDPSLIIVGRRVVRANPAALGLLGTHIIGEDVRLAIRHPAAAERLTGEAGAEESRVAMELMGIGEVERPWELIIHELKGNARFIRLADRSSAHAAEKMRADFVANASHELRTPLASLLGYIETLQDGAAKDKKTRNRFLEIMHGEASRMQRLIGDLMSLSRIEAEKYRAPAEDIDLGPLIEEACRATCIESGFESTSVEIRPATGAVHIAGDRVQITQLVSNLVGNALKYGKGADPVMVGYGSISETMVRITVQDHGEGIAAEHLPRLTERFYRIDPGRSRSLGGTGLGLAIVKHIVERHRGRLNIESETGRGTKVSVDLPKKPSAMSSSRNESVTKADAPSLIATRDSR